MLVIWLEKTENLLKMRIDGIPAAAWTELSFVDGSHSTLMSVTWMRCKQEIVEIGALLGDTKLLRAARRLVKGCTLDVHACDLGWR